MRRRPRPWLRIGPVALAAAALGFAPAATAATGAKTIVVAVDRSQSMAGPWLTNAITAGRSFVAAKAPDDRIEVLAFAHGTNVLARFSDSGAAADTALARLTIDTRPGTTIWDAIVLAAGQLAGQPGGGHVIVLLTDGQDVSSSATFSEAVSAAQRAGVAVYPIGIAGPEFTPAPLQALAAQTGGTFYEAASPSDLAAIYASIGRKLHPPSIWAAAWMPLAVSAAVGLMMLLAAVALISIAKGRWVAGRVEPHLGRPRRSARRLRVRPGTELARHLLAATERAFANVKQFRRLQRLLERADLPLRAAELFYICVGCGIATAFVATAALGSGLPTIGGLLVGAWLPVGVVRFKAAKRLKAFDNQLADVLITISASLKAGHSFRHSIQAVVDEGAEPTTKEFSRVLTETQLGRPMDQAITELADRVGSKNLTFVVTAVTIQRQVGGSLASLFDMVAETVRQRQQFTRKVRGLTAMGRASAYVLVGLPFFIALTVTMLSPAYMAPLYDTSAGHVLIGLGLTMLTIGSLILRRMVAFQS